MRNELCIVVLHSAGGGLVGAVLIAKSDSSRKNERKKHGKK